MFACTLNKGEPVMPNLEDLVEVPAEIVKTVLGGLEKIITGGK